MRATGHGFAPYPAVYALWSLPERRLTRAGMVAWGKKPQTTRASLYAETATHKMRTPTIDWDGPNSKDGTEWIWPASQYGSIATGFSPRVVWRSLPAHGLGVPSWEPGTFIYAEDLEAWDKRAGVKVGAGIALFVAVLSASRKAVEPWLRGRAEGGKSAGLSE
jgi:hypothetical protein